MLTDLNPASDAPTLILASSSPRRIELLRAGGYRFRVVAPRIDEPDRRPPQITPAEYAEALSFFKASAVAAGLTQGLVLGADTVVTHQGRVFGKPADAHEARTTLTTLAGTTHQVITGLTLLDAATGHRDIRHEVSQVSLIVLSDDQIERYLASNAWLGKAGAYGVQDRADAFINRMVGSFSNVVGLPMELLADMLRAWTAA